MRTEAEFASIDPDHCLNIFAMYRAALWNACVAGVVRVPLRLRGPNRYGAAAPMVSRVHVIEAVLGISSRNGSHEPFTGDQTYLPVVHRRAICLSILTFAQNVESRTSGSRTLIRRPSHVVLATL